MLIKDAQSSFSDSACIRNQFRNLNPVQVEGVWVVGQRFGQNNPMSADSNSLILLPRKHAFTRLCMDDSHIRGGHKGRHGTLARFRARFYTSHASSLAKAVCSECQLCMKIKRVQLAQQMGPLPPERLKPSPPFTYTMLDLFGPFSVRGEVQKRTTGKAWGALFTDLGSRAVHVELMAGYDTGSFLLALARFSAVRGWPAKIFSDPGSQLKGASEELRRAYAALDPEKLKLHGSQRGLEWVFGPANSPWYQGAAESLIKVVKAALKISIGDQRLSMPELLTAFTEAANLLNERPIGTLPAVDEAVHILTPNMLLLGRSLAQNPGGYEGMTSLHARVMLVQGVVDNFWKAWTRLYAPTLVQQSKWLHQEPRGIRLGDVVIVPDSNTLRGEYRLARVVKVVPSRDGICRRVVIAYKNFKPGEPVTQYNGAKDATVERALQGLSLLVPVTEEELAPRNLGGPLDAEE